MNQCYLWATPSGPINLMKEMPVRLDHPCEAGIPGPGCPICIGYEAALQAAKASSVPIQNELVAVSLIAHGQTIIDIEKAKAHYCKPGEVYGPFTVEYEIREQRDPLRCHHCKIDCLQNLKGIPCKAPVEKVAILLPDREEQQPAGKYNLLPCPFCGSRPEWINEALADSHYYIKCPHCHIVMKEDRRDKVIGMWNRRPFTITRKQ